jgi:patatin-like phospholipase/acyl hydrolase
MKILALNGGGMRGALHVGALERISEEYNEKYLYKIFTDGMYGISIGAIIASFIAFGFSVDELQAILRELSNIHKVFGIIRLDTILHLNDRKGIDNGLRLFDFLCGVFETHSIDLHTVRIKDARVPLHIIASDLTNVKAVSFGGNVFLWDALRASFALPVAFTPHIIRDVTYVDGAILCENITHAIPKQDIPKTLILLCYCEEITNYTYILMNCRSIKEIRKIKNKYPENTCCLTENKTPLFFFKDIEETLEHLRITGYSCMDHFFCSGPNADTKNSLNTSILEGPS